MTQFHIDRRATFAGALLPLALSQRSLAADRPADLVIWGGPVYTANDAEPRVEAVAARGKWIVYAGGRAGAKRLVGPHTRVIDLKGATLFPGFTDAHAHLLEIGERELTLNFVGTPSLAALVEKLKARVAVTPKGVVIEGGGWIETHWPEHRFLTRHDLDPVSPDNPVLLSRADGHALVANSAALKIAHVDRGTAAPSGGAILKDDAGEPAGMLIDKAMVLVQGIRAKKTAAFLTHAYKTAFQVYSSAGWTGMHNMDVDWNDIPVIEDFAKRGAAPLRVYNAVNWQWAQQLLASGKRNVADGRVITRMLKFFMDGALGSRGALLLEKYDDFNTSGLQRMQHGDVLPVWKQALKRGLQVATHAIGDRGNHLTIDWYEESFKAVPPAVRAIANPRWRIEHAQILLPSDIPRFARLGIIPSMQPSHAIGDFYFAPQRLGEKRLKGAYAWKSLIDAGSIVPGGSDAPVERGDPRIEFYAATQRKALNGFSAPDWHPEEAVDRATALKMFTVWPAYASFREHELGQIKQGYRADLTVFDVDLMTVPGDAIPRANAMMTVVDGEIAFQAKGI